MLSEITFKRINGHTPRIHHDQFSGMWWAMCQCTCGKHPVEIQGGRERSVSAALERLRDAVLAEHGFIAIDSQGWQCAECGRVLPLQVDHIRSRAHGRDDTVSNLRGVCAQDHARRHEHNIRPAEKGGIIERTD